MAVSHGPLFVKPSPSLPGSNRSDRFTITPEQHQIHDIARPIVRTQVEARKFDDESVLLAMLGLESA